MSKLIHALVVLAKLCVHVACAVICALTTLVEGATVGSTINVCPAVPADWILGYTFLINTDLVTWTHAQQLGVSSTLRLCALASAAGMILEMPAIGICTTVLVALANTADIRFTLVVEVTFPTNTLLVFALLRQAELVTLTVGISIQA